MSIHSLHIDVLGIILNFSDGCDPLVYRVLDDHRRSIYFKGNAVSKVYKPLYVPAFSLANASNY